jgi:hypothetical protein
LRRCVSHYAAAGVTGDGGEVGRPGEIWASRRALVLDVVVPVHNEAAVLAASIRRLHEHLVAGFPYSWQVTIVDNASTDGTIGIARDLAASLPGVRAVRLERKGRGLALRADVARRLVPQVHDDGWFFDTEPEGAHIFPRGIHEDS